MNVPELLWVPEPALLLYEDELLEYPDDEVPAFPKAVFCERRYVEVRVLLVDDIAVPGFLFIVVPLDAVVLLSDWAGLATADTVLSEGAVLL